MSVDRRDFILIGAVMAVGTVAGSGLPALSQIFAGGGETVASSENLWGMVIDTATCDPNCTACIDACTKENNITHFPEPELDPQWIRKVTYKERGVPDAEEHSFPMMCLHCEHPPCAHVCPVAATFQRKDGLVLVDKHRCIGCRYCMIACPYKARSFVSKHVEHEEGHNHKVPLRMHGVVEKCDFCVHRIDEGVEPACVEACKKHGGGGMKFGNLKDPNSEPAKLIKTSKAQQLRADLGTNPRIFYMGL